MAGGHCALVAKVNADLGPIYSRNFRECFVGRAWRRATGQGQRGREISADRLFQRLGDALCRKLGKLTRITHFDSHGPASLARRTAERLGAKGQVQALEKAERGASVAGKRYGPDAP